MEMFSRRFWKSIASYHRQMRQAANEYDACFGRFRASRGSVTREAQLEFQLEYELAVAELRVAIGELRAFQIKQLRQLARPARVREPGAAVTASAVAAAGAVAAVAQDA